MRESLMDCSYAALLDAAQRVSPSVRYNGKGYAPRWQDNLMKCIAVDISNRT